MTTFGLVHGAWHGAWCWERLQAQLETRGHRSVAVELPCDDASAGASEYAAIVIDALAGEDDVVLVGHSIGAVTIPLVALARTVRSLVYLAPNLPRPGYSAAESMAEEPINTSDPLAGGLEPGEPGVVGIPGDLAAAAFYNRCSADDVAWALERLRPQALRPLIEKTPLERFPAVPAIVILGAEDRMLDVGLMRGVAGRRLGVEPVVIDSDHSPFLSNPGALADLLATV